MTLAEQYKIEDYVANWTPTATAHRIALGDGWNISQEFLKLHLDALESVAVPGQKPSEQERAVMVLGAHGFNIFAASLKLAVRGEFDVALYLLRPLIDIQAQFYAVSKDSALASDYLNDKLKASKARKLVISDLVSAGDAKNATWLKDRWSDEAQATNDMAHSNPLHGDKLLEATGGSVTPWLGGRHDDVEVRMLIVGCLEYEHWLLGWYKAFHASKLPIEWIPTFASVSGQFGTWAKATVGTNTSAPSVPANSNT